MNDPLYQTRLWLQEELAKRRHGTKGQLAKYLGVRQDAITRMANTEPGKETRTIAAHELAKMKQFFGTSPDIETLVPLMGYVGAGAQVEPEFEQVPEDGLEHIEVEIPLPADMIAFEVRGESMYPQYRSGQVIIVYREQRKPLESFYGEEAIVRTADGRRFVKTIYKAENGVQLSSWNAPPIDNVHLEWIGEIFAVLPRSAVNHVERVGGIQGRLALRA